MNKCIPYRPIYRSLVWSICIICLQRYAYYSVFARKSALFVSKWCIYSCLCTKMIIIHLIFAYMYLPEYYSLHNPFCMIKMRKKHQDICTVQKKAVPLHPLLRNSSDALSNNVSLAQLVEQLTLNQWVEGSSPSGDTQNNSLNIKDLCANISPCFSFYIFLHYTTPFIWLLMEFQGLCTAEIICPITWQLYV